MLGPEGSCLTSVLFDFASKPFLSQRRQREQQLQFFKSVGIIVILGELARCGWWGVSTSQRNTASHGSDNRSINAKGLACLLYVVALLP